MKRSIPAIVLTLAVWGCQPAADPTFDLLIRGGDVLDGTGSRSRQADIGIRGAAIAAIGDLTSATAVQTIDATDLVVAPGFIDIHSHSDYSLLVDGRGLSKTMQGVTTELLGESSSAGPVIGPTVGERQKSLADLGLELDWSTLGEYFDRLERQTISVNIASTVASGQVRAAVVGYDNRPATPEELKRMEDLVEAAMLDGAVGLSSGLIYHPNLYATTEELIALAKVAARYGGIYVSHIRNENVDILPAIEEAIRIGREADIQVEVLHFKRSAVHLDGTPEVPTIRDAAEAIEKAQQEGIRVYADVYPYAAGYSTLNMRIPDWALEGGREKLLERLRDAEIRQRIEDELRQLLASGQAGRTPDTIMLGRTPYEPHQAFQGKRIDEIANELGLDPAEAYLELIDKADGVTGGIFFGMRESDVDFALALPWMTVGSDGSSLSPEGILSQSHPHPRSYGTFPRVLGHYVREKKVLSLPEAVRKMTSLPASRLGLVDRGVITVGKKADVVVFDASTIADLATFTDPHQLATGVRWLLVNGKVVIAEGQHTGAKPGRVLRHRRSQTGARPTASLEPVVANAKAERVDDLLSGLHEKHQFNGVVLVAEKDEIILRKAYGVKDFETGEPLNPDTALEVGSISKPFTATAVLQLVERGRIDLDDSLVKFFPNLPYEGVTLERMLSHTSGLYDVCCQSEIRPRFDEFYGKSDPPYSNHDYLAFIRKDTPALLAEPGESYSYSNTAYLLLALIVEQVSGQEFDDYLKQNIFDPVGLQRTFLYSKMDDPTIPNRALGYRMNEDGQPVLDVPVATPERPSVFGLTYGDDEIFSTVDDLFAFGQALKAGKLLEKETMERAFTPTGLANGDPGPYGLGWRVGESPDGGAMLYHTGSTNGFLAICTYSTADNDTTVILLTNVVTEDFPEVRQAVLEIAWGGEDDSR